MDYFGSLTVTVDKKSAKRWGVIFTCLSARVNHLELAHSLTTDSTKMAQRKMNARQGVPKMMISDIGPNLRGESGELKQTVAELEQDKIIEVMVMKNVEWKFNSLSPVTWQMCGSG